MIDSHGDMELMPQGAAPGGLPERQQTFLDAEPLVDVDSLDYRQRQTYQRQEVFLEAYVQYGTLPKAAEIANCHYDCAYQWRKRDAFHWNERWQQAVDRRREYASHESKRRVKSWLSKLPSDQCERAGFREYIEE